MAHTRNVRPDLQSHQGIDYDAPNDLTVATRAKLCKIALHTWEVTYELSGGLGERHRILQ
jgi:hypothetical protein